MNLSRVLPSVNQNQWKELLTVCANQYHQRKQGFFVSASHHLNTKPVSLTRTASYSQSCRNISLPNSEQCHGVCQSFLPQKSLLTLSKESSQTLGHFAGGLPHGYRPECQASVQFLHTHRERSCKHRAEKEHTLPLKGNGGRKSRQPPTVSESEGGLGRHRSKDKSHRSQDKSRGSEDKSRGSEAESQVFTGGLDTEEDLRRLSQEIVEQVGQKDVMALSVPLPQLEELVLGLYHCGWSPPDILTTFSTHPSLLLRHRHSILSTVHLLLDLGFHVRQVVSLLQRLPAALTKTSKSQITRIVDALRGSGFGEENVFALVSDNPSLLFLSESAVWARMSALRQLFKSADVITFGLKCPRLLSDPWEDVQAKFDYIFHEMSVTQKQMVHASLFNHSLSHIKKRHTFLVRAGFFNMAKRKEGERSPNAALDQIIATSDKAFCRKFGNFKVAEYRAFCQLFDKEQAALRGSDSDEED